ncbi:MAG: hypothetical protein ACI7YS_02755 [Flavobacterium sp.]
MKKTLLLAFGLCSFFGYSQIDQKNEIKANLPYFIAGIPEVSYERILDENSAVGLSVAIQLDDEWEVPFIITPYYRMYFGGEKTKTKATGFFIEADAVVAKQFITSYDDNYNYTDYSSYTTNFGFGAAVGVKLLNKNGYIGEVFGGISRVFGVDSYTTDATDIFPRVGINIGKRF